MDFSDVVESIEVDVENQSALFLEVFITRHIGVCCRKGELEKEALNIHSLYLVIIALYYCFALSNNC